MLLSTPCEAYEGWLYELVLHSRRPRTTYLLQVGTDVVMFSPQYPAGTTSAFLLCSRRGKGEEVGQPRHGDQMYAARSPQLRSSVEH